MLTKAPKGTKDILPEDIYKWIYIEDIIRQLCDDYGYKQIRTPVFEHTELFQRGVGDTTDVVQKEMYTFNDKGGRSITLRPEGTASAARSYIEHSLYALPQPVKMYYLISCYRYEKPQHGRLREFNQFGIEAYGSDKPSIDAEIISLAIELFERIGIKGLKLNINSVGCPECRNKYNDLLKEYLLNHYNELCNTCQERYEKNPLRIFDCKSEICSSVIKNAPKLLDNICNDCRTHFDSVKEYLESMDIEYIVNPQIVRGLDYYTKTVFEIVSDNIGSQGTVCGGGRYDKLIEELGGPEMPGIGFALGMERLMLILDSEKVTVPKPEPVKIFIVNIGEEADKKTASLIYNLRKSGISAEKDYVGKSVKAQMKYANKIEAQYTIVIGDEELKTNQAQIKNMKTGETSKITINNIVEDFNKLIS